LGAIGSRGKKKMEGGSGVERGAGRRVVATRRWEAREGVRPAAGPGHGGTGSSSAGAGERRERGGGPVQEKWPVGWPGEIRKKKKKWARPKATVPPSNYSKIFKWV
jgi:hypothetical protein